MTNLRLVLLATTALTAMQFAAPASHAQTAPLVVAQAKEELGPDGKPKQPPKGAPPAAAPRPARRPRRCRAAAAADPRRRRLRRSSAAAADAAAASAAAAPPRRRRRLRRHRRRRRAAAPPPPPARAAAAAASRCASAPPPPPTGRATAGPPKPPAAAERRARAASAQKSAAASRAAAARGRQAAPPAQPRRRRRPRRRAATAGGRYTAAGGSAGRAARSRARTPAQTTPPGGRRTTPLPHQPPAGTASGHAPRAGRRPPRRSGRHPPPARRRRLPLRRARRSGRADCRAGRPVGHRPRRRRSRRIPAPPPTVTAPLPRRAAAGPGPDADRAGRRGAWDRAAWRVSAAQRRESQQGGRTVFTEPGRIIIRDPGGQSFIRHNEVDRFRYGARDIRTQQVGNETRTIVIRPDGTQIITVVGRDGQLLRRIRRDQRGREIIIIDNSYRDPRGVGGFYVDLAPPVIRIPLQSLHRRSRGGVAGADLRHHDGAAGGADRTALFARRNPLQPDRCASACRASTSTPSTSKPDRGKFRPIRRRSCRRSPTASTGRSQANPRAVFLIEGHTDAVGNDVDNLSLSDRRAEFGRHAADAAIRRAGGKPDLAGLWRAISEGADRRAERDQPPRHHPQHHAAAQRRTRPRCRRPPPGTAPPR